MHVGAWMGAFALSLVGSVGCASVGAPNEGAGAASAHALAFEVSADVTDACTPSGRARVLATQTMDSEPVVTRVHDGWLSVTFTSLERGRMTLDLDPETLQVFVARPERGGLAAGEVDAAALSAVDANGHGIKAWLIPGPSGSVIAATPLSCPRR